VEVRPAFADRVTVVDDAASGWLTSCVIDAVKAPRLATCCVREFRASVGDSLFREAALRHILNCAEVLQSAIPIAGCVSDHVQVLTEWSGIWKPVIVLKSLPALRARSTLSFNNGMSSGWWRVAISASVTGAPCSSRRCDRAPPTK